MQKISSINAIQVFDSRGVPTISCKVSLEDGTSASAMVPSGASTGSKEALELRDNDISYHGKSVTKAVNNINNVLSSIVIGKNPNNQKEIDELLISFDDTEDKSKVGANAVVTKDVEENAVMVGIPAKNVGTATEEFKPYGISDEEKNEEFSE